MQLITINEAAAMASKSIQTIRRMIKNKKIGVRRQKTPQGFNYLVVKESLLNYLNQRIQTPSHEDMGMQDTSREHRAVAHEMEHALKTELDRFNMTIQKLIEQNEKDKENFFSLIKTFQERIFSLESQIKLIEAPKRSFWKFWK